MQFEGNGPRCKHESTVFGSMSSPDDALIALAYLVERTLSDLLILGSKISVRRSSLEFQIRNLKLENEKLSSELRTSRESEEQAYEKLKLLREGSKVTNSVRTDSEEAGIVSHTSVCLAYPFMCPLTARSWTSDNVHEKPGKGTVVLKKRSSEPLQSLKPSDTADTLERELRAVRISLGKAQAREEELKHFVDQSRRQEARTCELLASNENLYQRLATAQSEIDNLLRHERALGNEVSALTRTLSSRDQEVSVLREQVSSLCRLLSQRDDSLTKLETLLGEERIRSKRNRDVAAKVGSAAAQCRAEEKADLKRLRAQRNALRQEIERLQSENAKLVASSRTSSESDVLNSLLPSKQISQWIQAISCPQHSPQQETNGHLHQRTNGTCDTMSWNDKESLKSERSDSEYRLQSSQTARSSATSEEQTLSCFSSRSCLSTEYATDRVQIVESKNVELTAKLGLASRRLEQEELVIVALKAEVALLRSELASQKKSKATDLRVSKESANELGLSAKRAAACENRLPMSPRGLNPTVKVTDEKLEIQRQLDESRKLLCKEMLLVSELRKELSAVKIAYAQKAEWYYKSCPRNIPSFGTKLESVQVQVRGHLDQRSLTFGKEYKSASGIESAAIDLGKPAECKWAVHQIQANANGPCLSVPRVMDSSYCERDGALGRDQQQGSACIPISAHSSEFLPRAAHNAEELISENQRLSLRTLPGRLAQDDSITGADQQSCLSEFCSKSASSKGALTLKQELSDSKNLGMAQCESEIRTHLKVVSKCDSNSPVLQEQQSAPMGQPDFTHDQSSTLSCDKTLSILCPLLEHDEQISYKSSPGILQPLSPDIDVGVSVLGSSLHKEQDSRSYIMNAEFSGTAESAVLANHVKAANLSAITPAVLNGLSGTLNATDQICSQAKQNLTGAMKSSESQLTAHGDSQKPRLLSVQYMDNVPGNELKGISELFRFETIQSLGSACLENQHGKIEAPQTDKDTVLGSGSHKVGNVPNHDAGALESQTEATHIVNSRHAETKLLGSTMPEVNHLQQQTSAAPAALNAASLKCNAGATQSEVKKSDEIPIQRRPSSRKGLIQSF